VIREAQAMAHSNLFGKRCLPGGQGFVFFAQR
jgi:hypothetical protein